MLTRTCGVNLTEILDQYIYLFAIIQCHKQTQCAQEDKASTYIEDGWHGVTSDVVVEAFAERHVDMLPQEVVQ